MSDAMVATPSEPRRSARLMSSSSSSRTPEPSRMKRTSNGGGVQKKALPKKSSKTSTKRKGRGSSPNGNSSSPAAKDVSDAGSIERSLHSSSIKVEQGDANQSVVDHDFPDQQAEVAGPAVPGQQVDPAVQDRQIKAEPSITGQAQLKIESSHVPDHNQLPLLTPPRAIKHEGSPAPEHIRQPSPVPYIKREHSPTPELSVQPSVPQGSAFKQERSPTPGHVLEPPTSHATIIKQERSPTPGRVLEPPTSHVTTIKQERSISPEFSHQPSALQAANLKQERSPSSEPVLQPSSPLPQIVEPSDVSARSSPDPLHQDPEQQEQARPIPSIETAGSLQVQDDQPEFTGIQNTIERTPSPSTPLKRKREEYDYSDPLDKALEPLSKKQRIAWGGFAELESDPDHFNFIIRQFGVEGISVKEAYGLDEDTLSMIPKPIHGMIFLYSYLDDDEEPNSSACPENLWFANQVIDNACASVAIMNIVMNVPDLKLGPQLQKFKDETIALDPPLRGFQLSRNNHIRPIHNTFARKIDVINTDLHLSNSHDKYVTSQNNKRKSTGNKSRAIKKRKIDPKVEPPYHFVTYVPVAGQVWRLDGLQKNPLCIGDAGDDWMKTAAADIQARIAAYGGDELRFNLLCLTSVDSLTEANEAVARSLKARQHVEGLLGNIVPDWKAFMDGPKIDSIQEVATSVALSADDFDAATMCPLMAMQIERVKGDPMKLLALHRELTQEQEKFMAQYMEAVASMDNGSAGNVLARQRDNSPSIYQALKALSDDGELEDIYQSL